MGITGPQGRLGDRIARRRGLYRWARVARKAPDMPLADLRRERGLARELLVSLQEVTAIADNRLAHPRIGASAPSQPHGTDWSWRPALWSLPLDAPGRAAAPSKTKLGDELTLFHDCPRSELTLRQIRNTDKADLAPFGLCMEVFAFEGSFLSVVLDLPRGAVDGLVKRHLVRLSTIIELEKPQPVIARLNIKHGPNTEQIVRDLPQEQGEIAVDFDLAYTGLNEKRIERAWVDIIFDSPEMSQMILRHLVFSRRPRAEF